ncbi:MAG: xanthine dehydrogenase family protein molybdopterin-binding subunit [Deltaproteobacteria bacterium]|nr:xanthine dehydrogenase family protein molybdopterin-binding subunit [Deltaproteobacteria bacterium]
MAKKEFSSISVVGQNITRVDALDKVLGRAKFTADLNRNFPGLLYTKVLRSPHAHARIVKLDISQAEKLPAVRAVVTGKDCPEKISFRAPRILALKEVIWAGEGVAAVAAESPEIAQEAVELIQVEYEKLPAVFDAEEAMQPNPPAIVDRLLGQYRGSTQFTPEAPNVTGHFKLRAGDVEKGFAKADIILENRFSTSRISHSQLEPASCIVRAESDGGITIWTNGQGVYVIKGLISDLFGLAVGKVRVINPYQGGSFGSRLRHYVEPLTTLLALKARGTVQFTYSRQEMYLAASTRLPVVTYIKTGAKKDGTIVAQQMKIIVDNGASYAAIQDGRMAASGAVCVYRIANFFMDSYGVNTNTPWAGAYRGLGTPQVAWAVECQMDMLAEKLGMSPIELRRKNVLRRGEKNAYGEIIESIGVMDCLEKVAQEIKLEEPCVQEPGPWRKGKGVAMGGKQNTPRGRSEAEVLVHEDGTIEVLYSADEQGMGSETVMAQIAAEEFRIPISQVRVRRGDTAVTPYDTFSASSFTTYNTGNALRMACQDAIRQILQAATQKMEAPLDDLALVNGKIMVKGSPGIALADLFEPFSMFTSQGGTSLKKGTPVRGRGVFAPTPAIPWDPETGLTPKMWNWYQYNACGVELVVNIETGEIKILQGVFAADMGFPINPKMCEGQIEGGFGMAIGASIMEEYIYENGLMTNCSYGDYRIPTFREMPLRRNVKAILSPDPLPEGPWGAKGIGEGTMIAVAPAIANAVYNAIGVRIKDLPLSAERVLRRIKEKEKNDQDFLHN